HPEHSLIEFGGGEPLLHKEITDIISYLTLDMDKRVHIATNGTYVPPALLSLPKESRNKTHLQVSLHASDERLYGEITGKPRLFERVMHNLPIFKEYFVTLVNTVAYQRNFEDVPNIVELVKKYDLPHRVMLAFPEGRGKDIALLSPGQIAELTSYLLAEKASGAGIESSLLRPNHCPAISKAYGFPVEGACPAEAGYKKYITASETRGCEFLPSALIPLRRSKHDGGK
ncbi:MAG: radical SAM protein, partial [Nanoarchaeota archaeon]